MPPMFLLSSCLNLTPSSADLVMHSVLYAFHSFPSPGEEEVEGDQHCTTSQHETQEVNRT